MSGDTEWIERALGKWPAGLCELGEPNLRVPREWPESLVEIYRAFDGARLFLDAIELVPAAEIVHEGDRWRIGAAWGDDLWVDGAGRVWRADADADEPVLDGTSLARWLAGAIDAEAMLYDEDGEFADDVFDEHGELASATAIARARARMKRDGKAAGPRWQLARLLLDAHLDEARDLLEHVVADAPEHAWAWLDLARISEQKGELAGAIDEAAQAAEVARGKDAEGFFFAHAARLAALAGNETRRAELAARARAANPALVTDFVAGAEDNLTAGDPEAAGALAELARAVAPRDLAVLDLVKRLAASRD